MKVQIILPLSIAVSVAAFALMKVRVKEMVVEEKKMRFHDVKLRVTGEMLMEFVKEKKDIESEMEREKAAQLELQKALTELASNKLKAELDACTEKKKTATDENAAVQEQTKTFQTESAKEKADWEAEIAALKQKLDTQSPICDYLKPGASVQGCPVKKEEPKPEPPKPAEEKKPEEPKPEEKKPEPPKPEEKKPEEPKPEEKKPEPPKPEEKKPEPPKAEEKKPEPPKPEEKKPEEPKPEEKKPEPPKPEEKKPEEPKPGAVKPDAPKP